MGGGGTVPKLKQMNRLYDQIMSYNVKLLIIVFKISIVGLGFNPFHENALDQLINIDKD